MKKVAVIMGSKNDYPVMEGCFNYLKKFGIPFEGRVMSAHRLPAETADFAAKAIENGFGIIIAAAGKAAHLAGVIAGHTTLPVIGVPVKSSTLDGLDSLLSTVQMPEGIPVATVAINGSANAAILASEILALSDLSLSQKLLEHKKEMKENVLRQDAELNSLIKG